MVHIIPDIIPEEKQTEACRILDAAIRRVLRDEQARKDFELWQQARKEKEAQTHDN